jgi:hypothetical protein
MYRFSRNLEGLHGLAFISVQNFTQTIPNIWSVRLEDRTYSYLKRSQKLNNDLTHTHTYIYIYVFILCLIDRYNYFTKMT